MDFKQICLSKFIKFLTENDWLRKSKYHFSTFHQNQFDLIFKMEFCKSDFRWTPTEVDLVSPSKKYLPSTTSCVTYTSSRQTGLVCRLLQYLKIVYPAMLFLIISYPESRTLGFLTMSSIKSYFNSWICRSWLCRSWFCRVENLNSHSWLCRAKYFNSHSWLCRKINFCRSWAMYS
jgi:hypothetical protein